MDQQVSQTCFYLWHGQALFLGELVDAAQHQHHSLQIAVGRKQAFKVHLPDQLLACRGVMIGPDQPHGFDGQGDEQLILLLDPETRIAQQLIEAHLAQEQIKVLDQTAIDTIVGMMETIASQTLTCQQAKAFRTEIARSLVTEVTPPNPIDPRIQQALDLIKLQAQEIPSAKAIADAVFLSESRFIHLFTEQVGIPFRRYLLYQRLLMALKFLSEFDLLTAAAHEAGFADSAHLSRTFRDTYGLAPSRIFKRSQFIQVFFCFE